MLQQAKEVTNKIQGGKKSTKTADLIGEALGIFLHMPQFSLVFPGSVIRKIIISCLLLLFFFRVAGGTLSTSRCTQEQQGKDYFSDSLESFPGDHRLRSFFFRILKTYGYHTQEKTGIPLLDWENKNPLAH